MERFAVLEAPASEPATTECPPDEAWFDLASGIPREDLNFLLQHSAGCDHCGPLLRDALAVVSGDISSDEARLLSAQESARPQWQSSLAEKLRGMREGEPVRLRRPRPKTWWLPPRALQLAVSAALLVALAAGGIWVAWRRAETHSASRLIAQAYAEKRTIEMRIEGAPWAPLRHERGRSADEDRMVRPALLKAEGEIARHLKNTPDDVTWMQASGRTSLLEEGGEERALAVLDRAHELAPDNQSVVVDLASAYLLRGQVANRPQDIGTAIDLLGKTLAAEPGNETAQFNYAIALEQMGLKQQAVEAWGEFLRLHSGSPWSTEARERLRQTQQEIRDHDQRSDVPLDSVEKVAAAFSEQNAEEIGKIDRREEEYLALAVEQWLPEWSEERTPGSQAALQTALFGVARLARERHGDRWLEEMLAANRDSPVIREGVHELAESEEGIEASGSHAGSEARRAQDLFRRVGLLPGAARAELDLAMVYQLQHDRPRCLALAEGANGASAGHEWPWLEVQSRLEEGVCGDSADAKDVRLEHAALEIAQAHGYPILASRAENFEAAAYLASGDTSRAWNTAEDGLNQFWKGSYPELRGYNLLTKFHDLAEMQREWSLEVAVLREAVPMIASHPNIAMRAFEETRLGEAQLDSGDIPDAEQAFHRAEQMFDATPAGLRRTALMAEAEVGLAKADLQKGRPGDAERRLDSVRAEVTQLGDGDLRAAFYRTSGSAELQTENFSKARDDLRAGVRLAEQGLMISGTEAARWDWRHRHEATYRALVELELRSDPVKALRWWEWFKGANLRRGRIDTAAGEMDADLSLPELHLPDERGGSLAVISYAVFGDRISAWAWDSNGIRQVWIEANPAELNPLIQSLATHCSDPASSMQSIRAEAAALYKLLVRPVEQSLVGHEKLIIEPDGVLRRVPFELLVDSAGNYLGDRIALSISPGIEYLDQSRPWFGVTATSVASVVGNGQTPGWSPLPESDEEARAVAGMFRGAHLVLSSQESPGSVAAEMSRAQIFHFSGHAVSDVQASGLVTGNGGLLDALRLPESLPLRSQLVVLSACDSARGSDGYFDDEDSLVRRLIEAGVPEVVASRWMVDSSATFPLMRSFYRELLAGKPVSVALALASRDLRSRPEYSHPFFWAGFSVFGRG